MDSTITVQEFEAIMNKESLRQLPLLVQSMDENLFVNITDFIANPIFRELKLSQPKLVEVIKSSNKFHYDNKTGIIKFKEKADMNILMIRKFIQSVGDEVEKKSKEEMIGTMIKGFGRGFISRVKKIEKVEDNIFVVFEHEDFAQEVEKQLLQTLEKNQFNAYNKTHVEDLRKAEISLAAESLKRRVVSNFDQKTASLWNQVQFINNIILNPTSFLPRRFTTNSNLKLSEKRPDQERDVKSNTFNNPRNPHSNSMYLKDLNLMSETLPLNHHRKSFNKFDLSKSEVNDFDNDFPRRVSYSHLTNTNNMTSNKRRSTFTKAYDPVEEFPIENRRVSTAKPSEYTYSNNEIISVYFHMNFLKKFESLPEEFKAAFSEEIMTEGPKVRLEGLKIRKASVEKYIGRERSKTIFNTGNFPSKRKSSVSKARGSHNAELLRYYGLEDYMNGASKGRMRNNSLIVNKLK